MAANRQVKLGSTGCGWIAAKAGHLNMNLTATGVRKLPLLGHRESEAFSLRRGSAAMTA